MKMSKKVMLINYVPGEECRIAVVVDGKVEELYQERASSESHVGNIYKGRVTNVEPSIQAAFVEFGLERNGFLHISDLHPKYFPSELREETEMVGLKTRRSERPLIQKALRKGQEVLVQVLKEGIGNKGPTLTTYLSIPGRFLVMMPNMEKLGVSRKVDDDDARRAMKRILDELDPPQGFGFIVRTAGIGRTRSEIHRDLIYLQRMWRSIEGRMKSTRIGELFAESDLLIRTIRDVYSPDISQVIVDDLAAAQRASDFLAITGQESQGNVLFYNDPIPLFHRFGVEKQIESINSRVVPLPSGGSLVIETTEALVAIDVNSGKNRDNRDADTTAYKVNLEAVDEICRQLRLRDLGGVIVNDLIDMRNPRHRRDVEDRFAANLNSDRARTRTHPISQFGILEMTRQRMRPSLAKSVFMDCPACSGVGIVKNPESVALEAMRRLAVAMQRDAVAQIELTVSPDVAFHLLNRKRVGLVKLEQTYGKPVLVRVNANGPLDAITLAVYNAADQVLEPEIHMHFPEAKVEPIAASVNPADDGLMEEIKQTMEEAERERQDRKERMARAEQARLERQLAQENAVLENASAHPGDHLHDGQETGEPDPEVLEDEIAARASTLAPDFASELNEIVDDTRPPLERAPQERVVQERRPIPAPQVRRPFIPKSVNQPDPAQQGNQDNQHNQGNNQGPNDDQGYDDQGQDGDDGTGRRRRRRRRRRGGRNGEIINDDNRGNILPPDHVEPPTIMPEHDDESHHVHPNPLEPIEDPEVQIGQYQGAPPDKLAQRDLFSDFDDSVPQPGNVREPDPEPFDEANEPNGNIKPPPEEEQRSDEYGSNQDGDRRGRRRRGRRGRGQNAQGQFNENQDNGPLSVDPSDQAVNADAQAPMQDSDPGQSGQDGQGSGDGDRSSRRGRRGRRGRGRDGDQPASSGPVTPVELSPDDLSHTLNRRAPQTATPVELSPDDLSHKLNRRAPQPATPVELSPDDLSHKLTKRAPQPAAPVELSPDDLSHKLTKRAPQPAAQAPVAPVELPPDDLSHLLKLRKAKREAALLQQSGAQPVEAVAPAPSPEPVATFTPEPPGPVAAEQSIPVQDAPREAIGEPLQQAAPEAPAPVMAEPTPEPVEEKPKSKPRSGTRTTPSRSAITAAQTGSAGPKPALKPAAPKAYTGFRSLKKAPANSADPATPAPADNNDTEKG
jgi:Rne/Rng family ribonuclease